MPVWKHIHVRLLLVRALVFLLLKTYQVANGGFIGPYFHEKGPKILHALMQNIRINDVLIELFISHFDSR